MEPILVPVRAWWDVPAEWRETPVGDFLAYQNLGRPHVRHDKAVLLIGTCMDGRIALRVPPGFAFILRTAGANLAAVQGNVSYVLGSQAIRFVAVVGHTGCWAVGLEGKRAEIVEGLVSSAGWERHEAVRHVESEVVPHGIDEPAAFAVREAQRIEAAYPRVRAAAMLYDTAEGTVSLLRPGT